MACGDKYSHLVPTPVEGFSITDPSTWIVTGWDAYAERKAAADKIQGYVQQQWAVLKAMPGASSEVPGLAQYLENYDELPSSTWWTSTPDEKLVAMAQANAQDGTCILEKLDGLTGKGSSPVPGTGTAGGKSWLDSAASLLLVVGVVGGLWWFSQKKGASS